MKKNLILRDVFSPVYEFENNFEKMVKNFFKDDLFGGLDLSNSLNNSDLEIYEDKENYYLETDMPGIDKKDISIEINKGHLKIEAERKSEEEKKDKKYYRMYRSYGKIVKTIPLPENTDTTKIDATMKDGILKLSIPKREIGEEDIKKIEIH